MSTLPDSVRLAPGAGGLPMLRVDGPTGWAEVYLHGAHVTAWAPRGQESVLWLSGLSRFDESTAIRGGIPVCFPWFGPLAGRPDAPRHGFARTAAWTVDGADDDGQDVTVRLALADSDATRGSAWPHPFAALCTVVVGARLTVALEVTSTGDAPVTYEEALHTYLAVADVMNAVGAELDSVHRRVGVGTGHRDVDVAAAHPGAESAERHLHGRAVIGIGDQPVGQLV